MRPVPLTWKTRGALWLRLGLRLLLAATLVWIVIRLGRPVLSLFAPFLLAFAAAAALDPLIRWFRRKSNLSRGALTLLLLLALLGLLGAGIGLLGYAAGQELLDLAQNWDVLLTSLQSALDQMEHLFSRFLTLIPPQITQSVQSARESVLSWLSQSVPDALTGLVAAAGQKAMALPSFFVALIVFVMATYFLTADYPRLHAKAVRHMDEGLFRSFSQIRTSALGALGGYLKAELLLSFGVFWILLIGFVVTRQPYSLLLALGLALLDFIPIVGAGTVMIPWAIVALFGRDYSTAIEVMVIWGVIALFRRVMEPKFVGDQTGLSPILSLLGIYVGMKLAGIWGMILGPVLTLVVLNLADMGLFHGLRLDLEAAAGDISAILAQHPEPPAS